MGSKFSLTPWLFSLVSRGVDYIDWPHTKIHIDYNLFMPKEHNLKSWLNEQRSNHPWNLEGQIFFALKRLQGFVRKLCSKDKVLMYLLAIRLMMMILAQPISHKSNTSMPLFFRNGQRLSKNIRLLIRIMKLFTEWSLSSLKEKSYLWPCS